jgi:hypothetical protein
MKGDVQKFVTGIGMVQSKFGSLQQSVFPTPQHPCTLTCVALNRAFVIAGLEILDIAQVALSALMFEK